LVKTTVRVDSVMLILKEFVFYIYPICTVFI
jgi:hypothetical protein